MCYEVVADMSWNTKRSALLYLYKVSAGFRLMYSINIINKTIIIMVKQNLLTKLLLLFALIVGSTSVWGQTEIKSPDDVVSGKAYYIKGVYTSSKVEYTMYYGPTETDQANQKVISNAVSDINSAMPVTFTKVEGGWTLQTPNGNFIRPHTSNGQSYFVADAVVLQLSSGNTKEGNDKGIKIGPYTSGSDNYYFQANQTSSKIGAYKNTQWDVTLIEVVENTDAESSLTFTDKIPSITFPTTNTYTGVYTVAEGYNGTISYELKDNTAGATIDQATGKVTVTQEGSVKITATAEAIAGSFKSSSDSYVLTVTDTRTNAGLAYDVENVTVIEGETIDGPTLTNINNLPVTFESSDVDVATVDATTGKVTGVAVGSAIITASFVGNVTYKASSVSYTVNVKKEIPAGVLLWESVSGYSGSTDSGTALSASSSSLDSDKWNTFTKVYPGKVLTGDENGNLKFGSKDDPGTAVTKSIALTGTGKLTYKVQRYDTSNSGNLKITVTGATATGDVDVTGTGAWVEKTVYLTDANGSVVITFATTSSNTRIRVDDILLVESASATITSAGYATFSSDKNVDFSDANLTVYTATDNGASVTLNEVESKKVPANTAVVLKGDAGSYEGKVITSADALTDNDLKVATEDLNGNGKIYVLNKVGDKVGFYKLSETGTLDKGKAYLESENAAPFLGFDGEDTTGINSVERGALSVEGCYTLDGRLVAQPTKGMYIVNGKKVILK